MFNSYKCNKYALQSKVDKVQLNYFLIEESNYVIIMEILPVVIFFLLFYLIEYQKTMACFFRLGGGWTDNRPTDPPSLKKPNFKSYDIYSITAGILKCSCDPQVLLLIRSIYKLFLLLSVHNAISLYYITCQHLMINGIY